MATFAGLVAGAAAIGTIITAKQKKSLWYRLLSKPSFQPPDRVFGPVWTVLYGLTAVSGYRVYRSHAETKTTALALWGTQLGLNAAWTYLFFGKHRPKAAMVDLSLLFLAVGAYAQQARQIDRPAAWMMAPYLAWLGYAGAINAETIRENRFLSA